MPEKEAGRIYRKNIYIYDIIENIMIVACG
jgi:hypothetical protein